MRRGLVALAVAVLVSGCAPKALFVVLPSANGKPVGGITVSAGGTQTTLNRPYAAAQLGTGGLEPVAENRTEVDTAFHRALAARPILPHHFRLYFILNSDRLTATSLRHYHEVFADIAQRPAYQVEVVGHTDTLGAFAYDQHLSLARAAAIRRRLGHDGIDPDKISIAGRGKLDLLIPTANHVAQPRNRRVEIWVR